MEEKSKINNLEINNVPQNTAIQKQPIMEGELTGYPSIDKPWLKYYDEKDINSKLPEMTAYEYLCDENMDNLDTIAIEYYGTKINFRDFISKIDEAARAFYNLGIREGDVVTVNSISNPELEISFYALNKIGAVINLIDVRSDSNTLKKYISEVNSRVIISLDNFLPVVEEAIKNLHVDKVITISPFNSVSPVKRFLANVSDKIKNREKRENIDRIKHNGTYISWNEFINKYKSNEKVVFPAYQENKLAALVHTGGTTGVPKTVKLSNDNFNAMVVQFKSFNTYKKADIFLNDIVPFVAYGIVGAIHMPLCLGLTNVIAPIITPQEFTNFMIKYKPNNVLAVPTYWDDFVNDDRVKNMDLSFLKHPGCGGDSLPIEKEKFINEFFKSHNSSAVIEIGYGMTEVGSAAIACVGDINKLGSIGIPFVKNSVGIYEEGTENELTYNKIGELYMKSPTMMLGYLNNLDEENKVIKIHSDGSKWIHSGDLGYIDEEGFVYLVGRIKRMMIRGGFKLYPAEIENVILKNKAVENCCVISIPSELYGSEPQAHVVLKEEYKKLKNTVLEELKETCKENLPEYSQPYEFIFRESFPLTAVGKVDYKKLEKEQQKVLKK